MALPLNSLASAFDALSPEEKQRLAGQVQQTPTGIASGLPAAPLVMAQPGGQSPWEADPVVSHASPWENDRPASAVAPWESDPVASAPGHTLTQPWEADQVIPKEAIDEPPQIVATPTVIGELGKGNIGTAASMAGEAIRREFSTLIGPTEKERFEESIPFGTDEQGQPKYEYKPLGNRMEQEQGLMTPFVKPETYPPNAQDPVWKGAGKALVNTGLGIEGSLLSPAGLMMGGGAAVPALSRAAAGAFAADMAGNMPESVKRMASAPTTQGKIEAGLGTLSSLVFGGLGAAHAFGGVPKTPLTAAQKAMSAKTKAPSITQQPEGAPPLMPVAAGAGIPGVPFSEPIDKLVDGISAAIQASPAKDITKATYDAIGNRAGMVGEQAANRVRLAVPDKADRNALTAVIEAGGDKATMKAHSDLVQNAPKAPSKLKATYRHALANFVRLNGLADQMRQEDAALQARASAGGVDIDARQNYVTHAYDKATMPGAGRPIVLSKGSGGGIGRSFKKQRVFETYPDAISKGYIPQTMDVADLWGHHVRQVEGAIGQRAWIDAMRKIINPQTGQPVIVDAIKQPGGAYVVPRGYDRVDIHGHVVAVDEQISPVVKALTRDSGIPEILMQAQAKAKHSLLAFDIMHGNRMIVRQLAGARSIGYGRSLALLKYTDADLPEAVKQGQITQTEADWAKANREDLNGLMHNGLNVGRVSDALYRDVVKHIPVISHVNEWIFGKLSRAAITEVALFKLKQNRASFPELNEQQLLRRSAKEANELIGNLGRQGLLTSRSAQDMARLTFLAPQWTEGMARTETRAIGQTAGAVVDAAKGKGLRLGTTAKTMGTGLAAHFILNQIINYATRGKPTWENDEKGHKLDAFIPDKIEGSNGYWMSPMGLYAELSHDAQRLFRREGTVLGTAADIANNKLTFGPRAGITLATGKDFRGRPLPTDSSRISEAVHQNMPTPLLGRALTSKAIDWIPLLKPEDQAQIRDILGAREYKGQDQRQIISLLGAKIEPVESSQAEIGDIARQFRKDHGIPESTEPSRYSDLVSALRQGNMKTARLEYNKIVKSPKDAGTVSKHFNHYQFSPTMQMRSAAQEAQFRQSLDEHQQAVYNAAKQERAEITRRFYEMLRTQP